MADTKHPHDALIRDWLDGRAIQYRPAGSDDPWLTMSAPHATKKMPHFYTDGSTEYRRKPETVRYRVALMDPVKIGQKQRCFVVETVESETLTATHKGFVRWLTDWVEVEV